MEVWAWGPESALCSIWRMMGQEGRAMSGKVLRPQTLNKGPPAKS